MKLALLGVGLIGGSFAAALRACGRVDVISAFDTDAEALAAALRLGLIDRAATGVADAVRDADLVVLATPVGAALAVLRDAAPALADSAIVTDVGSTKASVVAAARSALGARFARFVPAHPIAGGERNGVAHANAELFRGRLLITTPLADTDPNALAQVEELWRAVGARVERLGAEEHDRIFAAVSHLPHVLAFALVAQIDAGADAERCFAHAGAGFRDFTRIAAASPEMWRDVCIANRGAIVAELKEYVAQLDRFCAWLDQGDARAVEKVFDRASRARRRFATDN